MMIKAKTLQVGDLVVTKPVDTGEQAGPEHTEEVTAVGIDFEDMTVDIRTVLRGQVRGAAGMPMNLELEIFRP
jgi:hypothetical protein